MRTLVEAAPPPLSKLLLVGLVSVILGLLCVRATIGEPPPGSRAGMAVGPSPVTPPNEPTRESAAAATEAPTIAAATDEPEAREIAPVLEPVDAVEAAEPDEVEAEVEAREPVPSAPSPTVTPSDFTFRRGRLAYLRCVGLANGAGRCPRDTSLEEAVWPILESVGTCPGVTAGSGDVRLHMGAGATELRFRDFGDRPIEAGVLASCLEPRMAGLRTDLRSSDLVVSFRFEIRR